MPSDDTTLDPTTTAAPARAGALEIRGSAIGLLDDPIDLRVRGAGPEARLVWRARYRDDDGRIWRAAGLRCEELAAGWSPLKDGTGDVAALRSLRPVSIDVRVETADGRGAARTLTRRIAGEGVRTRRWRDGLVATLHVPAAASPRAAASADTVQAIRNAASADDVQASRGAELVDDAAGLPADGAPRAASAGPVSAIPGATVVIDAAGTPAQAAVAALAAPLLASRGVLVLVVSAAAARATGDPIATACERLAAVPAACEPIVVLTTADPFADAAADPEAVVLPPGVGIRESRAGAAIERAAAWDRLLERLGALPRVQPRPG